MLLRVIIARYALINRFWALTWLNSAFQSPKSDYKPHQAMKSHKSDDECFSPFPDEIEAWYSPTSALEEEC